MTKVFGRELAPYTVTGEINADTGEYLHKFSATDELPRFAIICSDAIHNLRTALDLAWYERTGTDSPDPNKNKFPIYPTRKHLEDFIHARREQKSVARLRDGLLNTLQPYKDGNTVGSLLYALHQLDIRDKHLTLNPQVQVSHVWDEAAQDSAAANVIYSSDLINTYGTRDKYQGSSSASIIFGEGALPVEGKPVLQTVRGFETAVKVALIFLE